MGILSIRASEGRVDPLGARLCREVGRLRLGTLMGMRAGSFEPSASSNNLHLNRGRKMALLTKRLVVGLMRRKT